MFEISIVTLSCAAILFAALFIFTRIKTREIEKRWPPIGEFYVVDGVKLHAKFIKAEVDTKYPPIVFIHGASGNLRDQMTPFAEHLIGKADLLFVDRPGHGWSERKSSSERYPNIQAKLIVGLLDQLGIKQAMIVGHSFGGAVTASLAVHYPKKLHSLIFLAPVAYPWPGGIAWYYTLTSWSIIGHLFAYLLALPAGLTRVVSGSKCVFHPNEMPSDYIEKTGPQLVLRPKTFRANAQDLSALYNYLVKIWPRYEEITAPTIIISGDQDNVVFPYIHSKGLARHIKGAELVSLDSLGHKPDHCATEIALAAIHKAAGNDKIDLQAMAKQQDKKLKGLNAGSKNPC